MLRNRSSTGDMVPNPDKFPHGIQYTIDYIHSLGLKMGLYTSRSEYTCAGFAASCDHEQQDANLWASWGVDYVKDDSCGNCRDPLTDYTVMQSALWNASRPMFLSVEGEPPITNWSRGGAGNARRVGHDIVSWWKSAISLVDIASGLWPYAHNSSNPQFGGAWNDLDIMEIGVGEFENYQVLAESHMTQWCILKAVLLMGNDVSKMSNMTYNVLSNSEAIAVHQDPLGLQARRVAVSMPANTTLIGTNNWDSVAVISPCTEDAPTQQWTFVNASNASNPDLLYLVPCNEQDPLQQWDFTFGGSGSPPSLLKNVGNNLCVDSAAAYDPGMLISCNASLSSQQWTWDPSSLHMLTTSPPHCLDVYMFTGPDVEMGSCKTPGDNDANQQWTWDSATRQIFSNTTTTPQMCLGASAGPTGGYFKTTDSNGNMWCLDSGWSSEGGWSGAPCGASSGGSGGGSSRNQLFNIENAGGGGNNGFQISGNPAPMWNNDFGASGPWPHTRYVMGYGWAGVTTSNWIASNLTSLLHGGATQLQAADAGIIDDDLVGNVTKGGDFCLDVKTMGMLEVWAAPLSEGRIAVSLFNRSPADDTITAYWTDIGAASSSTSYSVRDIWNANNAGVFSGSYSSKVPAHGTVFLVLTPQ